MHKEAKDKDFLKKPIYKDGQKALRKFIGDNLRYPPEALEKKIKGTVYVKYTIGPKGTVTQAKVVSGIGYGCDEEALRLVKLLQFEVPKNRGLRVLFHQNIQIHFRLPKAKSKPVNVQYNYITAPAPPAPAGTEKKQTGYMFTIKIQ
ncbi:MAG: energy transducer TonB [Saprospiraceae bacterium]|nr:MAG: energy transducer TonB [Saprospiraceae bacterium]